MKYVQNRDFDLVSSALNYSTPDLQVLGGCDLYTTKAGGKDRKLYKTVDYRLEEQHKSNLSFSKSLSPPQQSMMAYELNLSRSSPFGNLSITSSRRTYAYLIATLNASHPDYDFTNILRPRDFKHEKSLRQVMNNIDTALSNLRARPQNGYIPSLAHLSHSISPPPNTQITWGPGMWRLIDEAMGLKECDIWRYAPEEFDPFEDDEAGALWSLNYFFFSKARKRVCYLYLRGISGLAMTSGAETPLRTPIRGKRSIDEDEEEEKDSFNSDLGASKRAKYWLGDERETGEVEGNNSTHFRQSTEETIEDEKFSPLARPVVDDNDNYNFSDEEMRSLRSRSKSTARGMSEEIVGPMEV